MSTLVVAARVHDLRQFDVVSRNDLISCNVIVAELDLDAVAQRRKHVGEDENFAPNWMVLLL